MATRSARENKTLNAKHAEILRGMLKRPENKLCADCKRNDPRWASTNLGCFMCIRCSGIHRSMGVHITRIKSIDLDTWTPEQVANVQRWGNKRANAYWEAHLRPGHMPPDHKIESFIRSKYESRRWAMEGPPPEPETLDGDEEPTPAPASARSPPASSRAAAPSAGVSLIDGPPPAPTAAPAPPAGRPSAVPSPPSAASNTAAPPGGGGSGGGGLFDLDFSSEASAAATAASATAARKDVKNDILSLFSRPGPAPATVGRSAVSSSLWGGPPPGAAPGGGAPAPVDPWGAFGSAPAPPAGQARQGQHQQQRSSLGGEFGAFSSATSPPAPGTSNTHFFGADPWASSAPGGAAGDPFGAFSSSSPSANGGKDVFSDIWK